jgi:Concanavalin A-like lectin/glucanases superfamily
MPDMTWGAWVRTDNVASGLRKIMGHDDGAWDRVLGLDNRAPDGTFRYSAYTGTNNNGPVEGGPAPVNTTDWTFIAASHTGSQITLYVDLNASTTGDPLISITEPAAFGPGFNTFAIGGIRPDIESESWDGVIDQVFVYNEVLSGAQLTQFRDQGFVIPEPSAGLLGGSALALARRRRR